MSEIEELLAKVRSATKEYTTIEVKFSTNLSEGKETVKVNWILYISKVTEKTGNPFPSFLTFAELKSFAEILVLELRRVDQFAVENAVLNAWDILNKKKE